MIRSNPTIDHSPAQRFNDIYRGKRVLVTGHTGFKGSWLSIWLKMLGAEVTGYSLDPPSIPNMFEACALEGEVDHVHGDVRDYDHLLEVFQSRTPEFVFHLAAQPLVRLSYEDPRLTYETNVMGTVNLLEAARNTGSVRVVVNVTSDKCYENKEWIWGYRENDPMGGHDPYSSSKGCAELVTAAYRRSFFIASGPSSLNSSTSQHLNGPSAPALASARAGNVIGGGDWGTDRLIPDCVRALSRGEDVVIRSPKSTRPWQHVLEPLYGYLRLGAKLLEDGPKYSGAWNFGPTDSEVWSVEEVVGRVCEIWGTGGYTLTDEPQAHEATWLKLDCSKARIELDWQPKYFISRALDKTVDWYKAFYRGAGVREMRELSQHRIREYVE